MARTHVDRGGTFTDVVEVDDYGDVRLRKVPSDQAIHPRARPSSVLFISSVMGVVGSPGLSIYSATKSALIGFAKSLSAELANQKIRVNCLSPGIVKSPLYNEYSKQLTKEMNDNDYSGNIYSS